MKKILIILGLLVVFSTNSNAQTKEETITWLQQKLQKYLFYAESGEVKYVSVEVTECFITIKFALVNCGFYRSNEYYNQYYVIPTDGVQFEKYLHVMIKMKNDVCSIREKIYNRDERFTYNTVLSITLGEENLLERLNKAVTHLATFCPRKQEIF